MAITAPTPEAEPPTTAEITETMLSVLRRLAAAKDRRIPPARYDSITDQLTENLALLMLEFDWPRGMALEAIHYGMTHGTTLREAMIATQTG